MNINVVGGPFDGRVLKFTRHMPSEFLQLCYGTKTIEGDDKNKYTPEELAEDFCGIANYVLINNEYVFQYVERPNVYDKEKALEVYRKIERNTND